VTTPSDPLPADLAAAHAMILAQREQLTLAKSEVTVGRMEIERLKLMLAKARREQFGQSCERGKLLVLPACRMAVLSAPLNFIASRLIYARVRLPI